MPLILDQPPAIIQPAPKRLLTLPSPKRSSGFAQAGRPALIRPDGEWLAMLPGLAPSVPINEAVGALTRSVLSSHANGNNTTSSTSPSFSLGTIWPGRRLVIGFGSSRGNVVVPVASSITVTPSAGTAFSPSVVVSRTFEAGGSCLTAIYVGALPGDVPNGATATVNVVWEIVIESVAMAIYAVPGLTTDIPHATAGDDTDPVSATLDIPAGGVGFGFAMSRGGTTGTCAGLTEDFDQAVSGPQTYIASSGEFAAQQIGLAVSIDFAAAAPVTSGVFASFGP